ncbi:hypothetical protein ILUMI_09688 [Ignelater luminosus]|uniref:Uncharacterized protein n=1 Tax=Ignelater luminosus TaxID=2038154 RepID=A0A8K0D8M6_IGNLU|nr:hypothetical protein ILUMI_09688 [Ignelater luminosus]
MNEWLRISILLCIFGFLKEIRPSEPFIYEYLTGPWWNISAEEVVQEVYPVGTYAYLAQLIIVFLITDLLRYKPLIILLALAGVVVWSMLIWSTTLLEVQILECAVAIIGNEAYVQSPESLDDDKILKLTRKRRSISNVIPDDSSDEEMISACCSTNTHSFKTIDSTLHLYEMKKRSDIRSLSNIIVKPALKRRGRPKGIDSTVIGLTKKVKDNKQRKKIPFTEKSVEEKMKIMLKWIVQDVDIDSD